LPSDVLAALSARYEPALAAVERDGPEAFIAMALADILGPEWQTRMSPRARERLEAQAAIAIAHARAFEAMSIGDDDLRALAAPTLFLYGDRGMDWEPLIRDRIGKVRPDFERRMIDGASHNLHMEYPELVNAAIVEFLSGSAP
jgi:pimeloyl-ACP methyl ester carboxylesterase